TTQIVLEILSYKFLLKEDIMLYWGQVAACLSLGRFSGGNKRIILLKLAVFAVKTFRSYLCRTQHYDSNMDITFKDYDSSHRKEHIYVNQASNPPTFTHLNETNS
ncbi:hypothetical protein ACJX0J_032150, partial [Zea mays]